MKVTKRNVSGRGPVRVSSVKSKKASKGSFSAGRHGFQPLGFVVILFLFVVGGSYLYSVNQNAVQGFHMRTLEKEISALKDENAQLQIDEADERSLARIEELVAEKNMQKVNEVKVINEDGPIALR